MEYVFTCSLKLRKFIYYHLTQGSVIMNYWLSTYFFSIKFYWNTVIRICLHYGSFLFAPSELNGCDRDQWLASLNVCRKKKKKKKFADP